ncbi:MAG: hypothetical protein WBP12_00540 [Candidatus Saccharimonas sp.]
MSDTSTAQKIIDKIKDSSNVLVTVNSSPTVDELSAALAMTLVINKLDKHATAVFSGDIPPAIEFLNPEKTFENTVDSLRDFIIALDKEKADHLRYKVVDDMVKIFITPYRTTISEKDLDFSQGDYNVELVLAIGVKREEDLDRALESHGRILHDATVVSVSLGEPSNLGGIEWTDGQASSFSEMLVGVADGLRGDKKLLDEQISTAFLTGIVAATDRFSNERTASKTMTVAAQLMAAGANQQLIATKLEDDHAISSSASNSKVENAKDGELNNIPEDDTPGRENMEASKETESKRDDKGALLISHEPKGSVDEVTEQLETKRSNEALELVEDELAKQTKETVTKEQSAATEAAEEQLADQLATVAPVANVPSVTDLQNDIASASDELDAAIAKAPEVTLPPVAPASAVEPIHAELEADTPSLGGTLNATTEQAEADKRSEIEADRNRTILSHGSGGYATAAPTFQAPINSVVDPTQKEPNVKDIFAGGDETAPTAHADVIEPPKPMSAEPTLADIEAKTHAAHSDARAAIDAALASEPTPQPLEPATESAGTAELPPLPPLPPMPDFSTLPPLPSEAPMVASTPSVPDTLGDMLPPAPAPVVQPSSPADPQQFRIPGQ